MSIGQALFSDILVQGRDLRGMSIGTDMYLNQAQAVIIWFDGLQMFGGKLFISATHLFPSSIG